MAIIETLEEVLDTDTGFATDYYVDDDDEVHTPITHLDPIGGATQFAEAGITEANGYRLTDGWKIGWEAQGDLEAIEQSVFTVDIDIDASLPGAPVTVLMGFDGAEYFPITSVQEFDNHIDSWKEGISGNLDMDEVDFQACMTALEEIVAHRHSGLEEGTYFTA